MTTRKYSSRAQQTALSSPITATATTMTVVNGAAIMGGKTLTGTQTYTVVIDPDTALEEIVDVTVYSSGNTLTISRGIDGPTPGTGSAHSAGAVVRHMAIGRDYQEANDHIEGTLAGHTATTSAQLRGVISDETGTGSLVFGTSPTLSSPTITGTGAIAGTFTGNLTGNVTGNVSGSSGSTTGNAATVTNGVYTTDTGTVTSTMIANGTIVNADINASAAIDKTKISGTAVTLADTGTVTGTMIAADTIVNADVNSAAAIAYSKLALTGTITSSDIANDTIVNADINTAAAIDWTKLGISSTVSSTEIGYVDGVTSPIQTQIDTKLATTTAASTYAPLASPALTGVPTAPTAAANTNTTQVATTAFVQTELTDLIGGAPGALDTLNELAAALSNDASYSTTITTALATKLPLAGGTMTGAIAMGTNKITGLGTPTVGTDATTKTYVDGVLIAPSNLTGPITSVGSATSVAAQTGTGSTFVMNTSPTLVTPVLGVATATSVNGTTIPSTKTLVVTTDKLSALAATTSAELAGVISDETGSGALVFGTSPTLTTPVLGVATGTSFNSITGLSSTTPVANGTAAVGVGTTTARGDHVHPTTGLGLTASGLNQFAATTSAQLAGVISDETGSGALVFGTAPTLSSPVIGTITNTGTLTLPTSTDTLVGRATTDTLTNKTLTSPVINSPKVSSTYTAKTAAYTFASGDEGNLFSMNNAASVQFNIPTDATFNFAVGTEFNVFWITGAGQPTIGAVTPGTTTVISTGATSATPKLRVANSGATIKKLAANSWIVFGDIS